MQNARLAAKSVTFPPDAQYYNLTSPKEGDTLTPLIDRRKIPAIDELASLDKNESEGQGR